LRSVGSIAARLPLVALVAFAAGSTGCIHKGFFTDGGSVSMGRADRGALRGGRALPTSGVGYTTPSIWVDRGNRFGTDELVDAIERAARTVAERMPGGTLGVGDLSRRGGGSMRFHKSHENGRDADLIFYAVDDAGEPVAPGNSMPRYNRRLQSRPTFDEGYEPVSPRHFDVPRNWALVAALVSDPEINVEYLFISESLREKLLEYARSINEPGDVVLKAARALRQPGRRTLPHDDHLHLRIKCPTSDLWQGCADEGKVRLRMETWRDPAEEQLARKQRKRRVS
jgi:penicillin-insensitive murein endopeptidase